MRSSSASFAFAFVCAAAVAASAAAGPYSRHGTHGHQGGHGSGAAPAHAHAAGVAAVNGDSIPQPAVWPQPQSLSLTGSAFTMDADTFTFKASGQESGVLTRAFARYSKLCFVGGGAAVSSPSLVGMYVNVLTNNMSLSLETDESYTLNITAPLAHLTANTVYGALRGLETFAQLIYVSNNNFMVAGANIHDFPRFQHRGILIDTARHYLKLPAIMAHLDAMAYSKFNVLHWHIVDDQSFPYVSKAFPNLSAKGAYAANHIYAPADVASVIAYAADRGIRVIPEFDTPGHTQSWGLGQPGLLTPCYSNGMPDGSYGPVNPTLNSTYEFLTNFFTEITQVFPDHYIHLGGDEVPFGCWSSNPEVTAFMTKHNIASAAKLEQFYEQSVLDIMSSLQHGYIVWQEIFDNGVQVRPDTVIEIWKNGWESESQNVTAAGLRAILSTPWYLNYISYGADWVQYYQIEPLDFNGTAAQKALIMGGEACMWAEYVDNTNFVSRMWPRAASVGERLWSAMDVTDTDDAARRLHSLQCLLIQRGINAEPPNGPSFCQHEWTPTYTPPFSA